LLTVFTVLLFAGPSAATQTTAAEWKLKEGDTIRYKIVTLLLNGSRHADDTSNYDIALHDVNEGDVFTLIVGEISSEAEDCEWGYSIWTGGREVSSTRASSNRPCEEGTALDMIFPIENRDHYESVVTSINSHDDNRTATLTNDSLEIIEENQYYTEIMHFDISEGYQTYYYKAEGSDILEYKEQKRTASPGDLTVIGLAIWSLTVLLCFAAGGWVIRHKNRPKL
jgi:hypothetical protein